MRHAIFAALLAALLTTSCTSARAKPKTPTQEAIDQIAKLTANVKSFSADFTTTGSAGAARPLLKGSLTFMLPNSLKITMTMRSGIQIITISDGKTTWTQIPALKMIAKVDVTKLDKALAELGMPAKGPQHNIANPLWPIKTGTAKLVGSEKAGDVECWVFEGPPETAGTAPAALTNFKKARVHVSKKDGLARRMAYTDAAGKALMESRYDNVKVNVKVDASMFTYTPPKGANVQDSTGETITRFKTMIEKRKREK